MLQSYSYISLSGGTATGNTECFAETTPYALTTYPGRDILMSIESLLMGLLCASFPQYLLFNALLAAIRSENNDWAVV
jgi:hypothetical protein